MKKGFILLIIISFVCNAQENLSLSSGIYTESAFHDYQPSDIIVRVTKEHNRLSSSFQYSKDRSKRLHLDLYYSLIDIWQINLSSGTGLIYFISGPHEFNNYKSFILGSKVNFTIDKFYLDSAGGCFEYSYLADKYYYLLYLECMIRKKNIFASFVTGTQLMIHHTSSNGRRASALGYTGLQLGCIIQ